MYCWNGHIGNLLVAGTPVWTDDGSGHAAYRLCSFGSRIVAWWVAKMKHPIDEKKVTFLQSNTARMYVAILLMLIAASFHPYMTAALLLWWYANKVFGDD